MTAHMQDQDAELDPVVIARAEGMLSARHHIAIVEAAAALVAEARALGVPILRLARDLVGGAGTPERAAGGSADRDLDRDLDRDPDLDLAEEVALHEQMRRREPRPPALDAVTEAHLRRLLGPAAPGAGREPR